MNLSKYAANYSDHPAFRFKRAGVTGELRGNIAVMLLYVSEEGHAWNDYDIAEFEKVYQGAIDDIINEANQRGIPLRISTLRFYEKSSLLECNILKWTTDILKNYSVISPKLFQEDCKCRYELDEAPLVFAINRKIRSFAFCANTKADDYTCEFSIVDRFDRKNTIVHELLHQFGAVDFYTTDITKLAADKYLKDSVMNGGSTIDSLTRFLIGWDKELSDNAIYFLEETKVHKNT